MMKKGFITAFMLVILLGGCADQEMSEQNKPLPQATKTAETLLPSTGNAAESPAAASPVAASTPAAELQGSTTASSWPASAPGSNTSPAPADASAQASPSSPPAHSSAAVASPTTVGLSAAASAHAVPVTRAEAGLRSIPYLAADALGLDKRLGELAAQPDSYTDDDFRAGVIRDGDAFIAGATYKGAIAGSVRIGSSLAQATEALGQPSWQRDEMLFYKTGRFYLGIRGVKTVEEAVIAATPAVSYQPSLLAEVLNDLHAKPDEGLDSLLNQSSEPQWAFAFNDVSFINGGGWMARSQAGLVLIEFDTRYMEVYNNYDGELYRPAEGSAYTVKFEDSDSVAERLEDVLSGYREVNEEFATNAKYAPGGTRASIYEWFYSMLQYFTVRTTDGSKPDYRIPRMVFDYTWLTDDYILYTTFADQNPMVLDVRPGQQDNDDVNVLQAAGIDGANIGYDIDRVEKGKIRLKSADNDVLTISFQEDGNGGLRFTRMD